MHLQQSALGKQVVARITALTEKRSGLNYREKS